MATSMPNPQAAAPQPGGGGDASQQDQQGQQANPLQTTLGKLAMFIRQLATQNVVVQPELQQASSLLIQALQKASQAAPGPASPMQAPPQG
jgi:hypothetical protein